MQPSTEPLRYQPAPTVSWNEAAAEIVLFDQAGERYHALNSSGSAIWRALITAGTVDGAIADLVARFGAERGLIEADVGGFLSDVLDRKLIVAAP